MRIIKFRAWNSETKQFELPLYRGVENFNINNVFRGETLIYQQFTGLHDKNEKEIYEGDVISEDSKYGRFPPRVVAWEQAKCRFASLINGLFYPINRKKDFVIGNIYENPDLCT